MTWKTYFETINDSGLTKGPPSKIVVELFIAAGRMAEFSNATAQSWLNGNRKCKVISYFPNGKIENTTGTFNFFRKRPDSNLRKLQQIFRELNDDDSPIDTETDDLDILCWSLRNQFLDLLGFERLDTPAPTGESPDDNQNADTTKNVNIGKAPVVNDNIGNESRKTTQPERMSNLFSQSFEGFAIEDFIDNDPVNSLSADRISDAIAFVARIMYKHKNEDSSDKSKDIYKSIINFTNTLYDYLRFLKSNSVDPDKFPESYTPLNSTVSELEKEADNFRQQLKSLYQQIKIEIEKEEDEYHKQQRVAHKETWDKNTLIASL